MFLFWTRSFEEHRRLSMTNLFLVCKNSIAITMFMIQNAFPYIHEYKVVDSTTAAPGSTPSDNSQIMLRVSLYHEEKWESSKN